MVRKRKQTKQKWGLALGALLFVTMGAIVLQSENWAQQSTSVPANPSPRMTVLDADLIRVGISDDGMTELEYPNATVSATGPFKIVNKTTQAPVWKGKAGDTVRVSRSAKGFSFAVSGGQELGPLSGLFQFEPAEPSTRLKVISVTRKGIVPSYKGVLEVTPGYSGNNKFTLVNILPMQEYLKAVVPNELPFSYGYEAVKAQSVAARNYAIHPREKPWPQFDICDSQYCQAYYGSNTEHPQTTRALQETQGLVALYKGEPILALYSSSHGGYAENYENAFSDPQTNRFPGTPIFYLRGGPDRGTPRDLSRESEARAFYANKNADSYDIYSPMYRWQKQWSRQELEAIINRNLTICAKDKLTSPFISPAFTEGSTIGVLKDIRVPQRGISGKAMQVIIEGSNGTWTLEKEFVIRKVLQHNGRFLPSANVVFDLLRDKQGNLLALKATGGGMGHGVGMSQLGASYMSKQGKPFVEILQHYYKGTALGTIPLTARENKGMKTRFYVPQPQGALYVENPGRVPVKVALNDREISVPAPKEGSLSQVSVRDYLKPHTLNTLTVYPLKNNPGSVKAWIEVYGPQS